MSGTKYVIIKRCCNCNTLNDPAANTCLGCGNLMIKPMNYTEWVEWCSELQKRAETAGSQALKGVYKEEEED